MDAARKTTLWIGAAATLFALGVAIYTGNGALFLLAGFAAVAALGTAATKRSH
jgi:hypothetical protein